jgi:hypothetical protein
MNPTWHLRAATGLLAAFSLAAAAASQDQTAAATTPKPAAATPLDGRIVRVVYTFATGGTWGFHLAHMNDGRYCVRFGNPGRLRLATIERVADICFDRIPETVERSPEQRHKAFDTREKGKVITVVSFHKGAISAAGNDITLDFGNCNIVEGEEKAENCSLERNKDRFVVRFEGAGCGAAVTLSNRPRLSGPPTCEHYARTEP